MSSVLCGIDVSADSFVVLCIDEDGKRLWSSRSLDNDLPDAGDVVIFLVDLAN